MAFSTGPAMCGLFGIDHFETFSAVGDVIDFSSQLCALNAEYGSKVLISARTYALVKDNAEVRPMEMVSAPGSSQMSEVYELLAEKGTLPEADTRAHVRAICAGGTRRGVGREGGSAGSASRPYNSSAHNMRTTACAHARSTVSPHRSRRNRWRRRASPKSMPPNWRNSARPRSACGR